MQSEFGSRRGMRGLNRDGNNRVGGIPPGADRFMGRGPPMLPPKPSGMRNRDAGGPRMGAGLMRGDFRGGSFGGMGNGRYFDDTRDQWEHSRSMGMRNMGSPLDDSSFPMNSLGVGADRGRYRQNSTNFNSSDSFRSARGGFSGRFGSCEPDIRRARRMFQIPPGRFALPGPFPPRGNMMPEMRGRGMRPFRGFARNRRNEKNKKPQKQIERPAKKPSPPWFDDEVFKLLKDKGKAHKRMKRSNTETNVQAFKELRKEVRRLTRQKYNDYCIKEGIPNKYAEAAKAKKLKAEEAAAAAAAAAAKAEQKKDGVSAEDKDENTDAADSAEVVDTDNNTTEVIEENNVDSAQLANSASPVVSPVVENDSNPPVENTCDSSLLMEDSTHETAES